MSEDSLTHPPSFSNKVFRGNVTILEPSVNWTYLVNEADKTLELGEKIGFNMDGCYSHVKNVIE